MSSKLFMVRVNADQYSALHVQEEKIEFQSSIERSCFS